VLITSSSAAAALPAQRFAFPQQRRRFPFGLGFVDARLLGVFALGLEVLRLHAGLYVGALFLDPLLHLLAAIRQVLRRQLRRVLGRVNGLLQGEAVALQVLRLGLLELLQHLRHLVLGLHHFRHAFADVLLALQRIVGHGVDGLDDLRVLIQQVVDHDGASRFGARKERLQLVHTLPREVDVELQPGVRIQRRQPELLGLIRRQKVADRLRGRGYRQHSRKCDRGQKSPHRCGPHLRKTPFRKNA
jgi:hypothetical protein